MADWTTIGILTFTAPSGASMLVDPQYQMTINDVTVNLSYTVSGDMVNSATAVVMNAAGAAIDRIDVVDVLAGADPAAAAKAALVAEDGRLATLLG